MSLLLRALRRCWVVELGPGKEFSLPPPFFFFDECRRSYSNPLVTLFTNVPKPLSALAPMLPLAPLEPTICGKCCKRATRYPST